METFFNPISLPSIEKIVPQMKGVCRILFYLNHTRIFPGFVLKLPISNSYYSYFTNFLITSFDALDYIQKNGNKFLIKFHGSQDKRVFIDINDSRKVYSDQESGLLFIEINKYENKINYYI